MPPPTQTSMVDDPYYTLFMQNVIFEGHGEAFHGDGQEQPFDADAIQSQDDRGTYDDSHFGDHEDDDEDDHGNSSHEDDDLHCEDEEAEVDISMEPLCFIDKLTQKAEAQKRRKSIHTGSYSQAEDTLICKSWKEIGQDPIKALQGTLEDMMSQKEMREERKSKGKEEQMKIYLDLQTKRLDMEMAVKKRKLDIEEAIQIKKLEIEAINADTKAKEVALALMIVDKNNMSPERKAWFTNRQKEMFARDDLILVRPQLRWRSF
ncbi:hypothetical protein VPH35_114854 [Triticum aestivum]